MKMGHDSSDPCESCGKPVLISQVVRWPERDRIYWFLTGICRLCV